MKLHGMLTHMLPPQSFCHPYGVLHTVGNKLHLHMRGTMQIMAGNLVPHLLMRGTMQPTVGNKLHLHTMQGTMRLMEGNISNLLMRGTMPLMEGNIPSLHMRGTMQLTVGNEPHLNIRGTMRLMVGNIPPNLHMRGTMRLTVGNTPHLYMLGTIHVLGVCPGGRGGSLFDRNSDSRCWDIDTYTDQGSSQQPSRNASKGSKPENGTVPYRNCSSRCGTRIKFCCAAIVLPITLPLMIIYIHLSLVFFFQSPPIRIQLESLFSHCTDFLPSRHYCTYFHMTSHLAWNLWVHGGSVSESTEAHTLPALHIALNGHHAINAAYQTYRSNPTPAPSLTRWFARPHAFSITNPLLENSLD